MDQNQRELIKTMQLFTIYLTPFAIMLVSMGIIFGKIEWFLSVIIATLLTVTTIFNIITLLYAKKFPKKIYLIQRLRLGLNYIFNIALVYLMTPFWSPIWLMFLLTMIPLSLIESRQNTLLHTSIMSLVLLAVYFMHDMLQGIHLGEFIVYVLFLNMISVFVNQLIELHQ